MKSPVLVVLEGPIVVDQAEVGQGVNAAFAALGDNSAEKVAALHRRVPLADLGLPEAQPHVRVGVLQVRLHAAPGQRLDELRGVEPRQQRGIPVGHVDIHGAATENLVRPLARLGKRSGRKRFRALSGQNSTQGTGSRHCAQGSQKRASLHSHLLSFIKNCRLSLRESGAAFAERKATVIFAPILTRMLRCRQAGVPICNYGMTIAYRLGIFDRALKPFPDTPETYRWLRAEPSKG